MTALLPSHPPAAQLPCKICGGDAPFFDSCDFHANAKKHFGFYDLDIAPSSHMLHYYRCDACGFMFTPAFDTWTDADFRTHIYNNDYAQIDGTYHGYRAGIFANIFTLAFHDDLKNLSFLDYGGGLGLQADMLKKFGAKQSDSYDAHADTVPQTPPEGAYHFVSCIEVLEHAINPKAMIADLVRFLAPRDSMLFITTELQPDDIQTQRCKWWYCNPRVGHASFYTKESLQILFKPYDLNIIFMAAQAHLAWRGSKPKWSEKLLPPVFDNA